VTNQLQPGYTSIVSEPPPATGPVAPPPRGELADRVVDAVLSVPGVAAMHTGTFGEVATYLPGRKVNGVRIRDDVTEVHVVVIWGYAVLDTADAVRLAAQRVVRTRVDVAIQDVVQAKATAPDHGTSPTP